MCEAVERLVNKEKAKERAKANKKLKLERAKAKEEKINCIKNMFKAGATIEMIAQ